MPAQVIVADQAGPVVAPVAQDQTSAKTRQVLLAWAMGVAVDEAGEGCLGGCKRALPKKGLAQTFRTGIGDTQDRKSVV